MGVKFRRQHPIGRSIVDFYYPELKVVIELDGLVHYEQVNEDLERDATFHSPFSGFMVRGRIKNYSPSPTRECSSNGRGLRTLRPERSL